MKKSIITDFSSGTPSSTFSVATGYSVGSEWVNTNNGNRFYHKTGGNWVQLDSSPFYIQGGTTYSLDTTSDIYRTGSLNIGTGIASPVLGIGGNFVTQSYRFVVSSLGGTVSLVVDDRGGVYNRSKGTSNTLFGLTSLYSNTTGFLNTAIGLDSLFSNTTGNYNVGVGGTSLYSNTNGQYNVAIGTQALYNNLSGDHNIALGRDSLISNTIGTNNQGIGYNTLFNSTGNYNIAIGSNALYSNTTGSYNIGIGQNIQLASGNNINSIVIGASASGNGSNSVTLGSDSITKTILKGNIGFGTTSPSTKLHIYGTQSGLFRLQDGTQGNGYILTSDANGVGSWTASFKPVVETSSNYSLSNSDIGGIIIFTATASLTIPTGLVDGFECTFVTLASSTLTVVPGTNTLYNNTSLVMLPQLSFTLKRRVATNSFIATGNL